LVVPEFLDFAVRLESSGIDGVWLAEDCFTAAGPTMAAMILERTERLQVGLGILPAAVRNVAFTAMEVATLANAHPGRLAVGIGHGMPDWMRQVGAFPAKPLDALVETISVLRQLLAGEAVTFHGVHVQLHDVKLDQPPLVVPPVYAGVRRQRSLKASGQVADGTILAEPSSPEYVRTAKRLIDEGRAGSSKPHTVVAYNWFAPKDDDSSRALRAAVAAQLDSTLDSQLSATSFGSELLDLAKSSNDDSGSWIPEAWLERLAVWGSPEDAVVRIAELAASGADWCVLAPPPGTATDRFAQSIALVSHAIRA
jgi:alkanesulfonate monooxygenase SsuD/methylene tetrahydromethanopterin reductase-like flavin-dependent oxidoreductase (luciferase family)